MLERASSFCYRVRYDTLSGSTVVESALEKIKNFQTRIACFISRSYTKTYLLTVGDATRGDALEMRVAFVSRNHSNRQKTLIKAVLRRFLKSGYVPKGNGTFTRKIYL